MNDFSLYIMVKIGKVYLPVLAVFTYVCCIDSVMVVHNVVFWLHWFPNFLERIGCICQVKEKTNYLFWSWKVYFLLTFLVFWFSRSNFLVFRLFLFGPCAIHDFNAMMAGVLHKTEFEKKKSKGDKIEAYYSFILRV